MLSIPRRLRIISTEERKVGGTEWIAVGEGSKGKEEHHRTI